MKKWFYCFFIVIISFIIAGCNNKEQDEKSYLVIFETNGGITIPSQRVVLGENAIEPEKPTKHNYTFVGWYLNGDIFDFSMPINKDITLEARWKYTPSSTEYEKLLTVKFLLNTYDEPYFTETVNADSLIGLPPPPLKNGYIFTEWKYNNSSFDFTNPINDDIELLASWEKISGDKKYVVSFDSNGGTNVDNQVILQGNKVMYPVPPTRKGYTFIGWTLDDVTYNFDSPVSKDITLVANWYKNSSSSNNDGHYGGGSTTTTVYEYTVVFQTYGGTKIPNQSIIAGKKVTKPKDPTKTGYIFRGWNYNGSIYNFDNMVNSSMVLYAIWEKSSNVSSKTYKVTFNSNGGTAISTQKVRENSFVKVPNNPIRTGYTFAGWNYNGKNFDFNTRITQDITLIANWTTNPVNQKEYCTISFDSNGGSDVDDIVVEKGNVASEPISPNREGYIFNKWLLNGSEYIFNTTVKDNIKLKADWVKIESKKYTVYFDTLGGTSVPSQTIESGDKVAIPNAPTLKGFSFDCWLLNGVQYNFDSIVTQNITLEARWIPVKENYYNVIFESNGGTSTIVQSVKSGDKAIEPTPAPTRTGHTFIEWQLNGKKYDFSTPVTKELILYAKWQENKTYIVTFDYGNNTLVQYKVVEDGKTVSPPTNQYLYGYTFVEWQLNGKSYNFNTPITSNITLTALWKLNNSQESSSTDIKYYNVSFNSNGGSSISSQRIKEGYPVTKPQNPTRTGYTFAGWYINNQLFDFNTKIYADIQLVAKWK